MLLLNIFPKWTASGAAQDREKLVQSFIKYHAEGGLEDAARLVQETTKVGKKYGLSDDAIARFDLGIAQGLLANSVPVAAWMVLHIFSFPSLLAEIRSEVERLVVPEKSENGSRILKVDFARIRTECPLLVAVWHEVLRINSYLPAGRTVTEDTIIQDEYLLKKDATVFIFSGVLHADAQEWGPDFNHFNPRRFLPDHTQRKPHPAAYRAFGGGAFLCPGRHLAFIEITAFVATLVLGFEIRPEKGGWPAPERDLLLPTLGLYKPTVESNVSVLVTKRNGYEDVIWKFTTLSTD